MKETEIIKSPYTVSTEMPLYAYDVVINNYTPEDIAAMRSPKAPVVYSAYAHEVGEEGTPHLQGMVIASNDIKSRINSAIGGRASIRPLISDTVTLRSYVSGPFYEGDKLIKPVNSTFFEQGNFTKIAGKKKGQRIELEAVKADISSGASYDDIVDKHFEVASRCHRFIKERVQARDTLAALTSLRGEFESATLLPWQQALQDIVKEPVCPRKIYWIWSNTGNVGKSWMVRNLVCTQGATVLTGGKKIDMAYIFAQNPTRIVVFDLPRSAEIGTNEFERRHYLDGLYSLAEELKNGILVSGKYESKTVVFKVPHVIFFANFEPDKTKWSKDRYFVKNVDPTDPLPCRPPEQ
jgi:hypothetical protein